MNTLTRLNQIGGYSHLFAYTESHFARFQAYRDTDFQGSSDIEPEIRAIYEINTLVHDALNQGYAPDCFIQFAIEPSVSALQDMQRHFLWSFDRLQALKIVIKAQFQQRDWTQLQQGEAPISALSHTFMSIFEQWERLEWTDLGNQERLRAHELSQIFRSFFPCAKAMLSVWGDNTGFDATADRQSLKALNAFLAELLQSDF